MKATPVIIPLLNPNEPEAMLVGLHVEEGQRVARGDLLCTLETTKSTAEVLAEEEGFIASLRYSSGQTIPAGEVLCYLATEPGWTLPEAETRKPASSDAAPPPGLRITQPALRLARELGLDLSRLPAGPLVTEAAVRKALNSSGRDFTPPQSEFDPTAVVVYGGGGHGKSLIELLRALGSYRIVGLVDDSLPAGQQILGVPVLGGGEKLPELARQGVRLAVNAVGGIGAVAVRVRVFHRIAEAGFTCPAVVHPAAFVEPSARLSPGVQVFPHAYIGSEASVGFGGIVNTGAIVSHDCQLGDFTNISPGAMLAGGVHVGSGALVGMGATVNLEVSIGSGARIGNSATVKSDVPENGVVRAGTTWPSS